MARSRFLAAADPLRPWLLDDAVVRDGLADHPAKRENSLRRIEFFLVRFPALLHSRHDRLIPRIAPQAVIILVALEPLIIHIP
jgi:hypothetical protein